MQLATSVHSFKVDLAVKVLYIGMVLRLSITLKIPYGSYGDGEGALTPTL